MKPKITIGIDLARKDGDYTAITAGKANRHGRLLVLEVFTAKRGDPDYNRKLRTFTLKWHPNFFRRWLFRLLGV